MENNVLMTWLFIRSLKGIAFDCFRTFLGRSIKSWVDLEARFFAHYCKVDVKVSMPALIEEKQTKGESMKDFIKGFRIFSVRYPEGIPLSMLLQICRHKLYTDIETNMGTVCAHT